MKSAIAVAAHPDDIEFYMAGTLVLLKRADWEIHYLNLGNGCCGSVQHDARKTRAIRRDEARRAAKVLGAEFHESLCNDLEILYELKLLRRLVAPGVFVNTTSVQNIKRAALAEHKSQQDWLDVSQGLSSLTAKIDEMARVVGRVSKRFKFAEGWRRHLHYGFSATEVDPLRDSLGTNYLVNQAYERGLSRQGAYW